MLSARDESFDPDADRRIRAVQAEPVEELPCGA